MTQETATPVSRRTLRWLKIALSLSLALNLAVGGFIVGRAIQGPHRFAGGHMGLHELVRDLSPEGRAIVREIAREKLRPLRREMREMHATRERIHELVTAETVDIQALDRAFAALRQHNETIHDATHAATLEVIRRLPAEERRKLRFGEARRHGPHEMKLPPEAR